MRIHPKSRSMTHALSLSILIAFKGSFLFAITAAGACHVAALKSFTVQIRTSSIAQTVFYFWSFEIIVNILRILKFVLCLELYARHHLAF